MEETRRPVELDNPKTNFSGTLTPQQRQNSNNKRKLADVNNIYNSSLFKIRALLRQLRPQFIQVLQAPDFRNCKAAHELQIQMKHLMNLYKQTTMEIDPLEKDMPKCQPLSGENVSGRQSWDRIQDGKLPGLVQPQPSHQSAEKEPPTYSNSRMKLDDSHDRKSYIVGGSAFGWNFITYGGSSPVYYGVTKESYRNALKSKM